MENLNSILMSLLTTAVPISAVIIAALATVQFVWLRDKSKSSYNEEMNRAVLSEMRSLYDRQIAQLTAQMTATEERWKDANHLAISAQKSQKRPLSTNRLDTNEFLRNNGALNIKPDPKLVFVLTPFSDDQKNVYDTIKEVCNRNGFRCLRGDEEFTRGDILSHVVRLIVQSRVVIANISTRNPNVFFELGIAQALGKSTVLVSQQLEGTPFDIASNRIIIFKNLRQLELSIAENLLRAISDRESSTIPKNMSQDT